MAQSDADYAFIEEMRDWYYSFTNYIESEDEENDSLQKLKDVIAFERTQSKVSKALLDWTLEFLTTKFVHRLPLLCKRNYLFSYNGHVADNCFTESENSRLVRDPKWDQDHHTDFISPVMLSFSILMRITGFSLVMLRGTRTCAYAHIHFY